jgi:cell wall-associated NlpC family hydrolase
VTPGATLRSRPVLLALATLLLASTLACGQGGNVGLLTGVVDQVPRWACPTPTPLPYGEAGPIKGTEVLSEGGQLITHTLRFERWEREYGDQGGPPFPAPTPYTRSGTSFALGQLVNLRETLDLEVAARTGAVQPDGRQLFTLQTTWTNRGGPVPLQPSRQIVLAAVQPASGAVRLGPWQASDTALALAGLLHDTRVISTSLPAGTTVITVPVLAPPGAVQSVQVRFDPPGAVDVASAGAFTLQFTATHEAHCGHPGTVAAHYDAPAAPIQAPAAPIGAAPPGAAPPGTDPIIAFALQQLGRPYCWGGKGWDNCSGCDAINGCVTPSCAAQGQGTPCWDCSGLTWGAYRAAGITIRHGTSGQSGYTPVRLDQIQPGDLLLFSGSAKSRAINHVMLYAGDLNGDGKGDAIHAYNYPAGVLQLNSVLENQVWMKRLVVITRPPRGGTP